MNEKYYIIPKELASEFKQVRWTWFEGCDAVEIADGSYILPKWAHDKLTEYKKTITIADKDVDVTVELVKCPIKDKKEIALKTYEDEQVKEVKLKK